MSERYVMTSPEGFAPPCEHGQAGGAEFCVFCLRTRGDRALETVDTMARLLLKLEWSGIDCTGTSSECGVCGEAQSAGHAADCEIAAVLRAAGVLP